jgi:hypothetical protein
MERIHISFKRLYTHLDTLMLFEVNSYIRTIQSLTIDPDLSMYPRKQMRELTEAIDLFIESTEKQ